MMMDINFVSVINAANSDSWMTLAQPHIAKEVVCGFLHKKSAQPVWEFRI